MKDGRLQVAVVGVGHLGQHHARIYADDPNADLVAVVDTDPRRGDMIARKHRTTLIADYRELAQFPDLDAVSVAVPTVAHHEVASFLLQRGVHCLVEKPIATTVDQARDLVSLAEAKGLILQVGHIEHFNAAVMRLREMGGQPGFLEIHRLGPYDPRVKDVGVVLDLMIHDIDIALQIVNSPIQRVEALGIAIFTDKEDIANARITFENGCVANLTVSRVTPVKKRKLRIFQRDCYISINYAKQSMEIYRRVNIPSPRPGEPAAKIVRKTERLRRDEPLKLELRHFLDCVQSGAIPRVTGEHGRGALEVAIQITDLIRQAAKTNPVARESFLESSMSGEFVGYAPESSVPLPEVFAAADLDDEDED
jgi:predicted dehydrogenase